MENKILSWGEILKDLHMSDEDLRKIFTDALEREHICEDDYASRTETEECPCCHETLFKSEYLGDFICRELNAKYYETRIIKTLNTQYNLESILQYRPYWSDEDKTAYVANLNYINDNCDKLLPVHREIIDNSIDSFGYLTDSIAEFIVSYLRTVK